MVIEKFADGNVLYDHELNNKVSFQQNLLIGKSGVVRIEVPIFSSGDTPKVRLYLRGMAAGTSATALVHGVSRHYHGNLLLDQSNPASYAIAATYSASHTYLAQNIQISGGDQDGNTTIGNSAYSTSVPYTAVPQAVQIWIDGSEYTAVIADANSKGATMYDSVNDDWGIDGTTAWNTGELDLSSLITWTATDHYIEIKETGGTGGVLIYTLLIN